MDVRDLIAKDAILAEAALTKVSRLNGHNLKAHLLLAETYYLVGAMSASRQHLRSVLTIMPTAKEVQAFLRELNLPEDGPTDEFEDLAKAVEEAGAYAYGPEYFAKIAAKRGSP